MCMDMCVSPLGNYLHTCSTKPVTDTVCDMFVYLQYVLLLRLQRYLRDHER